MSVFRFLVPRRAVLAAALTALGDLGRVRPGDLVELPRRGLAHRHWRVRGCRRVLRVPILPVGDAPAALARQAEVFRRAAPSGHTPRLHAVLPPAPDMPLGGLLVEEITGRQPRVPEDLRALAQALAAIHALPVPPAADRPPLDSPEDSFGATLALIQRNLQRGRDALAGDAARLIERELAWAQRFASEHAAELRRSPRALVVTDAHPRNFLVMRDAPSGEDRAVCLDLERAGYANPAIDLAHAVLPIAVAWARRGERLGAAQRRRFVAAYGAARGAAAMRDLEPWLEPFRRLIALRTTAAYAAFRTSGAERVLAPAARRLARRAIADALDPERLARDARQWR